MALFQMLSKWHPNSHPSEKNIFIIFLELTKTEFSKGDGGEEKLKETFWKILAYCSWSVETVTDTMPFGI